MLGSYLYIYEFPEAVSSWLSVNFDELPPGFCRMQSGVLWQAIWGLVACNPGSCRMHSRQSMQCAGDFKMIVEVQSAGNQGTKRLFEELDMHVEPSCHDHAPTNSNAV